MFHPNPPTLASNYTCPLPFIHTSCPSSYALTNISTHFKFTKIMCGTYLSHLAGFDTPQILAQPLAFPFKAPPFTLSLDLTRPLTCPSPSSSPRPPTASLRAWGRDSGLGAPRSQAGCRRSILHSRPWSREGLRQGRGALRHGLAHDLGKDLVGRPGHQIGCVVGWGGWRCVVGWMC